MLISYDRVIKKKISLTREDCVFKMASTMCQRKMCKNGKIAAPFKLHCINLVQHTNDCKQRDRKDGKKAGRQAWGTTFSCSCSLRRRCSCRRHCCYHFSSRESDCSKGYIGMCTYLGITI